MQNAKYFRLLETRAGQRIKGLEFFFAAADTLIFATLVIDQVDTQKISRGRYAAARNQIYILLIICSSVSKGKTIVGVLRARTCL